MCRTTQRCLPPGPTSRPLSLSGSPCRSRHTRATDAHGPFRRRQELSNHARVSPPTARATRVHVAAHATAFLDVFAAPASLPLEVSSLLLLLFFPFPSLVLFESEARDSRRKTGCVRLPANGQGKASNLEELALHLVAVYLETLHIWINITRTIQAFQKKKNPIE